jgi:hypothetical protein
MYTLVNFKKIRNMATAPFIGLIWLLKNIINTMMDNGGQAFLQEWDIIKELMVNSKILFR